MKTEKSRWILIIDLLIYGILAGMVLYALLRPVNYIVQISVVGICTLIAGVLIWRGGTKTAISRSNDPISKIVMLDDDGERIKEWFVKGETSVLIGKSRQSFEVDIDLSDSEYASLVSPEHAVMNCVGNLWYIEDVDSQTGTGIRKCDRSDVKKLAAEEPEPIVPGDMIYIANTRLLIK